MLDQMIETLNEIEVVFELENKLFDVLEAQAMVLKAEEELREANKSLSDRQNSLFRAREALIVTIS